MSRIKCPNCKSINTGRIMYGDPILSDKLEADAAAGRVHFGGCVISGLGDDPNRHCNDCQNQWSARPGYKRRVNVRGVIFRDGKILAQRLKNGDDEYDFWCTPGGGVDDGEDLLSALSREMIEETGIDPTIGKLLIIQQFHDGKKEHLEFFFHIENADDYLAIDLAATSHGAAEVSRVEFVDPTSETVLPALLGKIDIESYISGAMPVLVANEL